MSIEKYPEHAKLLALRCPGQPDEPYASHNHLVGDFIEWLRGPEDAGGGYALGRWRHYCTACKGFWPHAAEYCPNCERSRRYRTENPRFFEEYVTTEALLAHFFGIDQSKIDAEKQQMLDDIGAANAARAS